MNLNSLIIVADLSRARLFRTAQTTAGDEPLELIELAHLERSDSEGRGSSTENPSPFSRHVARRAAQFAEHHFCNPVITVADTGVLPALSNELESALPSVYLRSVYADLTDLGPPELLRELMKREAFTPKQHPSRSSSVP
jgi:hypothetical protein